MIKDLQKKLKGVKRRALSSNVNLLTIDLLAGGVT